MRIIFIHNLYIPHFLFLNDSFNLKMYADNHILFSYENYIPTLIFDFNIHDKF